jgi:hypothetical protein
MGRCKQCRARFVVPKIINDDSDVTHCSYECLKLDDPDAAALLTPPKPKPKLRPRAGGGGGGPPLVAQTPLARTGHALSHGMLAPPPRNHLATLDSAGRSTDYRPFHTSHAYIDPSLLTPTLPTPAAASGCSFLPPSKFSAYARAPPPSSLYTPSYTSLYAPSSSTSSSIAPSYLDTHSYAPLPKSSTASPTANASREANAAASAPAYSNLFTPVRLTSVARPNVRQGAAAAAVETKAHMPNKLERMVAHLKHIYPERCSWPDMLDVCNANGLDQSAKRMLRKALAARSDTHFRSDMGGAKEEIAWHDPTSGVPRMYNRSDMRAYISTQGERGVPQEVLENAYPGAHLHLVSMLVDGTLVRFPADDQGNPERIVVKNKSHGIKRTHTQATATYETL